MNDRPAPAWWRPANSAAKEKYKQFKSIKTASDAEWNDVRGSDIDLPDALTTNHKAPVTNH